MNGHRLLVFLVAGILATGQNRQSNTPKGPANGYVRI
jgi:hypothetical protein